jgi:16S rRNA processing protein RimM
VSQIQNKAKNDVKNDKDALVKEALVLVGRVTSVFGIKGWVNVFSYTEPAENILSYSKWLLSPAETKGQNKRTTMPELKQCKKVALTDGQRHGKQVIAQLNQCDSREKAVAYVQQDIFIERTELPELEDEVYWIDLEGLQVVNLQNQVLGRIVEMLETGANDVMVVRSESSSNDSSSNDKREILIPYVEDYYVMEVDLEQGLVTVDWPLEFETEVERTEAEQQPTE